jgi:hypothetical protein
VVGLKIKADWQENKEKKAGLQQDIAKVLYPTHIER